MQRELQLVRDENNQTDRNTKAIERLEEAIRQIGSASGSDGAAKALLQVAVLQQRLTQLEEKMNGMTAGVSVDPASINAALADMQGKLNAMVDKAMAERLSETGTMSGAEVREGTFANRVQDSDETLQKDGLLWEFQTCYKNNDRVFCEIKITNQTREDKKACVSEVEIVTDTGNQCDMYDHRYIYVGSDRGDKEACATIPPLVTINALTETYLKGRYKEKIALLRYKCGNGCQMAVYDKPVSQ